jgi:UDP-N-acetylmuramate--alanine ligase
LTVQAAATSGGVAGTPIPAHVHLVGAAGMHMSAIGQILLARGHRVTGSDLVTSEHTRRLQALGGTVWTGHAADHLAGAGLVVITTAIRPENPELAAARERGTPVVTRAEMVQLLVADRAVYAVAGTHGKTTTSSLLAVTTIDAGLDPLVLLGGDARDLDDANARDGDGPIAVLEADEYKGAFLHYEPHVAVVTNIEPDHLDYFRTAEAMGDAFRQFAARIRPGGLLVACADSPGAAALARQAGGDIRVERYGTGGAELDWWATDLRLNELGAFDFIVVREGEPFGAVSLAVPGRHNVLNATAALAAAANAGVAADVATAAAGRFTGARRRFEVVAEVDTPEGPVTVVDDFAHHPSEVRATLAAAQQRFAGRRLIGCFQPHTYSRTRYLLDGFRTCFGPLDALYVVPTYAARETAEQGLDGRDLLAALDRPDARYLDSLDDAVERLVADARGGDVLLTLGAGDVTTVAPRVAEALRRRD